ncbi:MAG: CBS domain-containing protein [Candidatus Aenigmarchaeota archaeon]|nr:CBS domain-containing protein [Candidatus Aenigmarchaeota archaeon]
MLVKEIMSRKPVTLHSRDTLEKTVRVFAKHRISGCPVVDSRKHVVGIIANTDVLRVIDAQGRILKENEDLLSVVLGFLKGDAKTALKKILKSPVRKHMVRDVVVVAPEDDIANAVSMMNQRDIERLPVVSKGRLVGIISRKDVMRFLEK